MHRIVASSTSGTASSKYLPNGDESKAFAAPSLLAAVKRVSVAIRVAAFALLLGMALPVAAQDTQAPSVPTGLTGSAVSATQINLTWNASTDNVGVTGYYVYVDDVAIAIATMTSFQHIGLAAGTTYNYRVSAYDAVPNHSAWTATPVSVTTTGPDTQAPSVPTGLTGTAVSATQINLTWNASTDNVGVTGYWVYLDDVALGTTTTATSFQHTGLTADTTYNYRVSAHDAVPNHSAWTATPVSVTTTGGPDTQAPSVPTGLTGTAVSATQINLTWNASTDNVAVTGYWVYLNDVALGTTTTATSFQHTGLTASTTYNYRVSAHDAVPNHSAWTATPVSVTTVPTGPTANYAEDFDDGAAQGWTGVSGTWAVDAGTDHSTGNGPADISVYGGGSWTTGFTYRVRVNNGYTGTGNLAGPVYNYQDTSNYYSVTFAPTGTAHLKKVINGTTTTVATASYSGGSPNVWFDVDVIRSGTSTTVKVNGVTVFNNIVQSELGAGKIGLITNWTDGRFDDVALYSSLSSGLQYPRLGAYAIGGPHNYDSATFRNLALKYHVVVVGQWPGWQAGRSMTMAAVMADIKNRSTVGTKLFIYVNNNEMPCANDGGAYASVWQKVNAAQWWLYQSGTSGNRAISAYGGGAYCIINNTNFGPADAAGKTWLRWKADFDYAFNVTGDASNAANSYVDGFFMDNILWKPRADGDWNRDGVCNDGSCNQTNATVQGWLRSGYKSYFDYIRTIWPSSIQFGNADWGEPAATIGVMDQVLDGGAMEGMIGYSWSVETWGGFDAMMAQYRKWMDAYRGSKLAIFGQDNFAAGDYRTMRYGLASTLMDDGYFYITDGDGSYSPDRLLWFDEFDFNLGSPIQSRQAAAWSQGVWRRDFDNGIVLVNPKGNGAKTIQLGGTFRKLSGTQDSIVNNGATVTSVTLQDRDGIILRR